MKTTVASKITSISSNPKHNKAEQSPPSNEKGKVMAVVAVAKYSRAQPHKSSNKAIKEKLIRVLLDSGSDGDLLFHEKGHPSTSPTWLGRYHAHGIRRMEYSKQKEEASSRLSSLNTAIAKSS